MLADSFWVLPITRVTTATAVPICAKASLLSLIQGLQITSSSGTTIVNEQTGATPIVANLKMLLDADVNWIESNEVHYRGKDNFVVQDPRV